MQLSSFLVDILYPTDNWQDIPVLPLGSAATELTLPFLAWGSLRRRGDMPPGGTWHCYVDDYRFRRLWEHPDDLTDSRAVALAEPNYSVFVETPLPLALWSTYRKRWLARYWAERGFQVWADLNVAAPYAELNLVGIPRGWPAYCTRGYAERIEDLSAEYALARDRAERDPLFLVYSGGETVRELCHRRGWLYVDDRTRAVRRQLRELESVKG